MSAAGESGAKGGVEDMTDDTEIEDTDGAAAEDVEFDDPEELDDTETADEDFDTDTTDDTDTDTTDTDDTETTTDEFDTTETDETDTDEETGAQGAFDADGSHATGAPGGTDYEAGDVNVIATPARGPDAATRTREGGRDAQTTTSVEVLDYLARAMADDPDAVVIREEQRRGSTVLRLHVSPQDMGRIIGRRGRTAQAIRTLVGAAGARDGVQTVVDIADD